MLIGKPTRFGAGMSICGDYNDMRSLYDTVMQLGPEGTGASEFLAALGYDLRKAYEGFRDLVPGGDGAERQVDYCAVRVLWPVLLPQVGLVRFYAGRQETGRRVQSNIYALEAAVHEALDAYDLVSGRECWEWVEHFACFPNDYLWQFIDGLHVRGRNASRQDQV